MTSRPTRDVLRRIDVLELPAWLRRASAAFLRRRRWKARRLAALDALSPGEKALLRQYLDKNTRILHVPSAGVAISLEHADVLSISREPQPVAGDAVYALRIDAWVWERLCRHPELLGT